MLVGVRETDDTVAVLFGGRSSEHEVSLRSALYVLKRMPAKYRIVPVGVERSGALWSLEGSFEAKDFAEASEHDLAELVQGKPFPCLPMAKPVPSWVLPHRAEVLGQLPESPVRILNLEAGVFFPVLHGPNGEDGRLQGVFELAELAYVGCDLRASVVGIDKNIQKILAREAGVPVARYEVVELEEWHTDAGAIVERVSRIIGFPCFVKPNSLGSAVGVNRADDVESLRSALREALRFDRKALIEERMVGTEVECAFLGSPVSPRITVAGEIVPQDFYSYEAKYLDADAAALFVPARLEPRRMQELRGMAARLARAFGLEGLCRIDFWNCLGQERFVFNEINTMPGLTSISMFPKLWEHDGTPGEVWIGELIEQAKARRREMARLAVSVKTEGPV